MQRPRQAQACVIYLSSCHEAVLSAAAAWIVRVWFPSVIVLVCAGSGRSDRASPLQDTRHLLRKLSGYAHAYLSYIEPSCSDCRGCT